MLKTKQALQPLTADPKKYPQGFFKDKPCRVCGTMFSPQAPSHLTCSRVCAQESQRDAYYKRVYGISANQWREMYDAQGGLCAICRTEGWLMRAHHEAKLMVDHCHGTGKVRGLLCHNCNRALGLLKDSKESIQRALEYLERATTIP